MHTGQPEFESTNCDRQIAVRGLSGLYIIRGSNHIFGNKNDAVVGNFRFCMSERHGVQSHLYMLGEN